MGEFGDDYKYPTKKEPSSKPLLGGQNVGPDGDAGENATFVVAFTDNILIPTDSDGTNPVYADAVTSFEAWEGNVMLAKKSALDGWTSALHSTTAVTVDDTVDFEATVTIIAANHGSFIMKFEKVGYNTLYCKVHVHKVKKGVPGDTGDTGDAGDTGADGPTGPTGQDGTGLVVVKKLISMSAYYSTPSAADNTGGLRFTSTAAHELVLGSTAYHSGFSNGTYNGYHKVAEILDTTHYRIAQVSYVSDDSGTLYNKSMLAPNANSYPQDLEWIDMVPDGTSLMEFRLVMTTEDDENEMYAYLGYERYPTVGWNFYLNGELYEEEGDQKSYPAIGLPYLVVAQFGIRAGSSRSDIHLRLVPYAGKNWNTYYTDVRFNLFVAYINQGVDALGL